MLTCTFENGNKDFLRHVVVDTLILKNTAILLVKRATRIPEGGKWGIVGGYMQRDETLEEAGKREILEETGYSTKDQTLLRIIDNPQRKNENRQNIAFVYFCTAVNQISAPDNESTEQVWFNLDNLPREVEFAFDYYESIKAYKEFLLGKLALPKLNLK